MNRRSFASTVVAFFTIAAMQTATAAERVQTDPDKAVAYIELLGEQAVEVLRDADTPVETREAGVQKLLQENLDLKSMGQFALGATWRTASPEDRTAYLDLFSEYVVRSYARRLGGYSNQTFSVLGSGPAGKYDTLVSTAIVTADQPDIKAGWRVKTLPDGSLKIIDLVVEGVSMLQTERAQFESVMQKDGLPGLIASLQDRLERIAAQSS